MKVCSNYVLYSSMARYGMAGQIKGHRGSALPLRPGFGHLCSKQTRPWLHDFSVSPPIKLLKNHKVLLMYFMS